VPQQARIDTPGDLQQPRPITSFAPVAGVDTRANVQTCVLGSGDTSLQGTNLGRPVYRRCSQGQRAWEPFRFWLRVEIPERRFAAYRDRYARHPAGPGGGGSRPIDGRACRFALQ
jgi:hypothetical protein